MAQEKHYRIDCLLNGNYKTFTSAPPEWTTLKPGIGRPSTLVWGSCRSTELIRLRSSASRRLRSMASLMLNGARLEYF